MALPCVGAQPRRDSPLARRTSARLAGELDLALRVPYEAQVMQQGQATGLAAVGSANEPLLRLDRVVKSFGDNLVLDGIDLGLRAARCWS